MAVVSDFAISWGEACAARGLTKFFSEIPVPDQLRSLAERAGREFVAAAALTPTELDDVLSEIVLLTMTDEGDPTWRMQRLGPDAVSAAIGGAWPVHFAKSFFRATSLRPDARRPASIDPASRRTSAP